MTTSIPARPRAAVIAAGAISAAVLSSVAYQEVAAARDRRRFPAPGRLVDIGGRRLHLLDAGEGSPAVVVVPALGEGGLTWIRIQRELAAELRVVLYDRAGTGWSDPPPRGRRTFGDVAAELRSLLEYAGIVPPYVLVAHSLGGLIARRFAVRYPGTVAGLVLVDSSHEGQASRHGIDGWPYGRAQYYRRALRWPLVLLVKARSPGAPSGSTASAYAWESAMPSAAQASAVPSCTLARMIPNVHSVALWSRSARESFAPVTVTSPHHSGALVSAASCLWAWPCAPGSS